MSITAQMVKDLREMTGVGPLDCKNALTQFNGDMQKAADFLKEKGLAKAAKKAGRVTNEGIIHVYLHHNNRLGVMLEINCETDFVAKTPQFRGLANDIALQIANLNPVYVRVEDIPADVLEAERQTFRRRAIDEGKPENVADKVAEGRLAKFYEDNVLFAQPFIKDDSVKIGDMVQQAIAELGENISIRRFARFAIGEAAGEPTAE
jgi:elongation factor Ts